MSLRESSQMYLETIYILTRAGNTVRSIDVVEYMKFSKPSVSRAIGLLRQDGLVTVSPSGALSLTEEGLRAAQTVYERHTVLTDVLMRLGVPEEVASEDACRMEHYISDESFEAIKRHIAKIGK